MIVATIIRFILTKTKPHTFRIPKNQSISITPTDARSLNFNFSVGLSKLSSLQRRVGKSW